MKTVYFIFIVLIMSSCYMSKTLERDVHVRLNLDFPVTIVNNGSSNFVGAFQEADYQEKFVEGMKGEFVGSKVIVDNVNPEFEITITEFKITESTTEYTVKDSTSDDHGNKHELTKLGLSARGTVVQISNQVSYSWSAYKDDEEKVTSLRSGGQIVTGQNKEKDEYREKEFNSDQASNLARKCGRRSGASIVKEILRALK